MPGAKAPNEHVQRNRKLLLHLLAGAGCLEVERTSAAARRPARREHGDEQQASEARSPPRSRTSPPARRRRPRAERAASAASAAPVGIVSCACISMRSNLRRARRGAAGSPAATLIRAAKEVHRLAVASAAADHVQPKVDRLALGAALDQRAHQHFDGERPPRRTCKPGAARGARSGSSFELRVRAGTARPKG